jgi:hypothetical protein
MIYLYLSVLNNTKYNKRYYNIASAVNTKNSILNKLLVLLRNIPVTGKDKKIRLDIDTYLDIDNYIDQQVIFEFSFSRFFIKKRMRINASHSILCYNLLLAERVYNYKHLRSKKLIEKNNYYKRYKTPISEAKKSSILFNEILKCNSYLTNYTLKHEDKISKTCIHPTRTLLGKNRNASTICGQIKRL